MNQKSQTLIHYLQFLNLRGRAFLVIALLALLSVGWPLLGQDEGAPEKIVLLVNDSLPASNLDTGLGKVFNDLGVLWQTSQTVSPINPRPTLEEMKRFYATFWITGGKFDEFDGRDAKLLASYLNEGGRVILMGHQTGNALSWNFFDKDFFGFIYQGTFDYAIEMEEIYGGQTYYLQADVVEPQNRAIPLFLTTQVPVARGDRQSLRATGVAFWRENGARSVWLGFNFAELGDEALQKRVVNHALWFLEYFKPAQKSDYLHRFEKLHQPTLLK